MTRAEKLDKNVDIVITKADIKKAITREPLERRAWVEYPDLKQVGSCNVCAVGAVLRSARVKNCFIPVLAEHKCSQWSSYGISRFDAIYQALQLVNSRDYLGALSVFFEGQSKNSRVTKTQRAELLSFVELHFPDDLQITVQLPNNQLGRRMPAKKKTSAKASRK